MIREENVSDLMDIFKTYFPDLFSYTEMMDRFYFFEDKCSFPGKLVNLLSKADFATFLEDGRNIVFFSERNIYRDFFRSLFFFIVFIGSLSLSKEGEFDYLLFNRFCEVIGGEKGSRGGGVFKLVTVEDLNLLLTKKGWNSKLEVDGNIVCRDKKSNASYEMINCNPILDLRTRFLCILAGKFFQVNLYAGRYDGLLLYICRENLELSNSNFIFFLGKRGEFCKLYPRTFEFLIKLNAFFYDLDEERVLEKDDFKIDKTLRLEDFYSF